MKSGCISPKIGKKKKNCQNPFQAITYKTKKKKKKKWHGPLSHKCREGKTSVVRPLKKTLYLCASSLNECTHYALLKFKIAIELIPWFWAFLYNE